MRLAKLNPLEQLLSAVVILVIVVGGYSWLRFIPQNNTIVNLQAQAAATERKLIKTRIPDEPDQDIEALLKQLDDQEQAAELIRTMADGMGERLAPFDSQELKVRISELARNTNVRISTNEAYVKPHINTPVVLVKNKKKIIQAATQTATDLILPASHSWIARMSADTLFHRPMQRLILEGDYQSIRSFIHGLAELQWQVTVVQLKLERLPSTPLRGYAQRLQSELVLAL
jgi:hypothetical protein